MNVLALLAGIIVSAGVVAYSFLVAIAIVGVVVEGVRNTWILWVLVVFVPAFLASCAYLWGPS